MVKDIANIHTIYPSMEYHSIYFPKFDIFILFFLHGIFSYLSTSKASISMIEVTDEIYMVTPKVRWNP